MRKRITTEQYLGLPAQPEPTCPLIDAVKERVDEADSMLLNAIDEFRALKAELCDANWMEVLDALNDVMDLISEAQDLTAGGLSGLEDIRQRAVDIRAWGQGWKDRLFEYTAQTDPVLAGRLSALRSKPEKDGA